MIVALILALAVLLGAVPVASAQTEDRGLFGIAPAKVLLETRPPRDIRPLQLTNTTRLVYDVRIFAAPLRQAPDGGLAYDASPEALRLARATIRLGETRYTMPPNSRRDLALRWLRPFPGQRVAPIGIVVQGIPRGAPGGTLGSDYRLVGTYLLRLPGGRRSGDFERLTAEQGSRKTLSFTAVVRNEGEVYDQPEGGRLVIRDARGRAVARGAFKGETILPGERRPFPITIERVLPAGDYTAEASMRMGGARRTIERRFRLVGPNELPTTKLEIVDLQASGFVGERAQATVRVRNSGTLETAATVRVAMPGSAPAQAERRLAPGQEATVALELGELRAGEREVTATALAGRRTLDTSTVTLTARPERSFASRLERWLSDHSILVIGLLVALVLALVAALAARRRRPQQRGRVDLNTASVQRLAEVPGIGLRAAERIVAWREEYGRFGSVADLQRVEGFDAERIEGLSPHVTAGRSV